jgi:hypothetical protein
MMNCMIFRVNYFRTQFFAVLCPHHILEYFQTLCFGAPLIPCVMIVSYTVHSPPEGLGVFFVLQ